MGEGVDVDDPGQSLDETDVLVRAAKEGQKTRVQGEGQVAGLVDEVIGGQDHRSDEHVAVDQVIVDEDHGLL